MTKSLDCRRATLAAAEPTSEINVFYKVQLLTQTSHRLAGGLYLVQADNPTVLDGVAKGLIARTQQAFDYVHEALPASFTLPATITLANPDTLALGRDLTYESDFSKINWDA